MYGLFPVPGSLVPVAPPPRDWTNFNILSPLYLILTKYNYSLKQIHYLLYQTNRLNGKVGKVRREILKEAKKTFKNDSEAWRKLESWLEENM